MDGVERGLKLPEPCNINLFTANEDELSTYESLPGSLEEAIDAAAASEFVRQVLPARTLESYLSAKRQECRQYATYHTPQAAAYKLYFERY